MNLLIFEHDTAYVEQCLRNGEIDHIEAASEGAETEFFQYLNRRGLLQRLAETYPLRRKKQEVPIWLYVASDLSLRLHGMQSFHGYPLVIRSGGLLNALGPQVGRKVLHPQTHQMTLHCPGFNHKNHYERQTPCDQDWLRKIARATASDKLLLWYNTELPRLLKEQGLFDSEGIFIGDASYVFVPDNDRYEGSVVLLFDEHNHPVNKEELTAEQLKRCRYRRCYKWVELLHTNAAGEFFFFVGMHLGRGSAHECPILYGLVEQFLEVVGRGVMKWLVVDRGFLDGERIAHLKRQWGVDTLSALKSNMAILQDAIGLSRLAGVKWQPYPPALSPPPTPPKPEAVVKREQARQRTLKAQPRPPEPQPAEKIAVFNNRSSWDACSVPLTVVLTAQEQKPLWGLVTTARTQQAALLRQRYHLRQTIEERHRQMKLFWELSSFRSANFNLVTNQVVFVALAYTLLQMKLLEENRPELNRMTRSCLQHQLLPYGNHIVVYAQQYFGFFSVPEYTGIIMDIVEPGWSKLRKKVRKLQREFLHGLKRPRSP